MSHMFAASTSFNGNISKWDVSSVTDMSGMFHDAAAFNGELSKWDVSSVNDMSGMFDGATAFNNDISKWDVSSVTDMSGMFHDATAFNGDISKWDVSSVKDTSSIFDGATSFKQTLCGAWANSNARKDSMFQNSPASMCPDTGATTALTISVTTTKPAGKHTNEISTQRSCTRMNADFQPYPPSSMSKATHARTHTSSVVTCAGCPSWCEDAKQPWTAKCDWSPCRPCGPCGGVWMCVRGVWMCVRGVWMCAGGMYPRPSALHSHETSPPPSL